MRTLAAALLFAAVSFTVAGCGSQPASDPCAGSSDACVVIHVVGNAAPLDQLALSIDVPTLTQRLTPTSPSSIKLPAQFAVFLPTAARGTIRFGLDGLSSGKAIAHDEKTLSVPGAGRYELTMTLDIGTAVDAGAPDATVLADLVPSGADLTTLPDLTVVDLANADLTSLPDQTAVIDQSVLPDQTVVAMPDMVKPPDMVVPVTGLFSLRSTLSACSSPHYIVTTDFDKDGRLDLALACEDGSVNLYRNDPSSSTAFTQMNSFAAGVGVYAVTVADFNQDGRFDLATANHGDNTVSVLMSSTTWTFNAPTKITVGNAPFWLASGDLNNDTFPEIAVTAFGGSSVTILRNTAGTLTAQSTLTIGSSPIGVAIADISRDGLNDIVTCHNSAQRVTLLVNTGNFSFTSQSLTSGGSNPYGIHVADINADGRPDVLTANDGANSVGVLLNPINGLQPGVAYGGANLPGGLASGDFDRDGRVDIVTANISGNNVSVFLNAGNGTFSAPSNYAAGNRAFSVAVGDYNLDGKLDLAVANNGNSSISILFGN